MKLIYQLNDNTRVEVEGDTQRAVFEELASLTEVFGETQCGKCKSPNIIYRVRTNKDDDKFYELVCKDCKSVYSFGCTKKGGALFPHRKDKDGKWLENNGWTKWVPPSTDN